MSWTLDQHAINHGNGASPATCSWPAATAANALCLMAVGIQVGGGTVTFTTPSGWTKLGEEDVSATFRLVFYGILQSGSRSGQESVAFSGGTGGQAWVVDLMSWNPPDTHAQSQDGSTTTGTESSTTPATGNVTIAGSSDVVVGYIANSGGSKTGTQSAPTNGFTQEDTATATFGSPVSLGLTLGAYAKVVSASGSYSTGCTLSQSNSWATLIAAFRTVAPASRRRAMTAMY